MELEVRGASVGFGGVPVLAGVDVALGAGEIGALLGPSGAGKTTLLRAIAGFEPLLAGEVRLGGRVLAGPGLRLPPEQRGIGMVFQDFALLPHLDALANVRFGLHRLPRAEADARAREMLALVGLSEAADRAPHQLSGGQQQRVALARALAPRPALVLLDEPFSSLDPELRERLALDVRAVLKAAGVGALMVTHSRAEAFSLADRIGVVADGRLLQWASAYELYHRPASRQVAETCGEGAFLRATHLGEGRLDTPVGPLHAPRLQAPAGAALDLLLRPDDVVHDDAAPLQAEIVQRRFRGAEFLYALKLDSGDVVLAQVPSHHDHAVGQRIGVRFDLEHVVAFAR